jgi:hypothetical protein
VVRGCNGTPVFGNGDTGPGPLIAVGQVEEDTCRRVAGAAAVMSPSPKNVQLLWVDSMAVREHLYLSLR